VVVRTVRTGIYDVNRTKDYFRDVLDQARPERWLVVRAPDSGPFVMTPAKTWQRALGLAGLDQPIPNPDLVHRHVGVVAYQALRREAERLGMPRHYGTDLTVHDCQQLTKDGTRAPVRFGWALRECGTHLVDPRSNACSDKSLAYAIALQQDDSMRFYLYDGHAPDGHRLQPTTPSGWLTGMRAWHQEAHAHGDADVMTWTGRQYWDRPAALRGEIAATAG
jgi:hypothetical protein